MEIENFANKAYTSDTSLQYLLYSMGFCGKPLSRSNYADRARGWNVQFHIYEPYHISHKVCSRNNLLAQDFERSMTASQVQVRQVLMCKSYFCNCLTKE